MNMTNKELCIRQSGQENYIVLCPEQGQVPLFEIEYLYHRQIEYGMPCEVTVENGQIQLWYCLTGCNSLGTLLKTGAFGESELCLLFRNIYRFCLELERNLLNSQGAYLDLETIFYKSEGHQLLFCYNPEGNDSVQTQMIGLIEEMLTLIDYKNRRLVDLLYKAYEIFSQENGDYGILEELGKDEMWDTVVSEPEAYCVEDVTQTGNMLEIYEPHAKREADSEAIERNIGMPPAKGDKGSRIKNLERHVLRWLEENINRYCKKVTKKMNGYKELKPNFKSLFS